MGNSTAYAAAEAALAEGHGAPPRSPVRQPPLPPARPRALARHHAGRCALPLAPAARAGRRDRHPPGRRAGPALGRQGVAGRREVPRGGGAEVPCAAAARLLSRAGDSRVSAKTVMLAVRAAGERCVAEDARAARDLFDLGIKTGGGTEVAEVCVEADGTWVSPRGAAPRRLLARGRGRRWQPVRPLGARARTPGHRRGGLVQTGRRLLPAARGGRGAPRPVPCQPGAALLLRRAGHGAAARGGRQRRREGGGRRAAGGGRRHGPAPASGLRLRTAQGIWRPGRVRGALCCRR